MSPENKALIERWAAPGYSEHSALYALTVAEIDVLLNAVRAEERARAIEVMRKTADDLIEDGQHIAAAFVMEDRAAYLTDSQLLAKSASNPTDNEEGA